STAANSRRVRSFSPRPTAANRSRIADGSIIRRVYPARVRAGIHRGEITGYPIRADSLIVGRRLRPCCDDPKQSEGANDDKRTRHVDESRQPIWYSQPNAPAVRNGSG